MPKTFEVDAALIRELAALLDETGLSEIELGDGERRVRVVRRAATPAATDDPEPAAPAPAEPAPPPPPAVDVEHPGAVTSPMVGTVYIAPEPGAPPFVKLGDSVTEGQTLLLIEAMKVMNPIRAPRDGTVKDILVDNGRPVEFGEVLLILE